MYAGKVEILEFSDKIIRFIETTELVNEHGNLIIDYIEKLHLSGYPVLESDIEKQVYIFYNYVVTYNDLLISNGEDYFIDYIVSQEMYKLDYHP